MNRRSLLALGLATSAALAAGALGSRLRGGTPAPLPEPPPMSLEGDPRLAERSLGDAAAPLRVQVFFDLTCSHCGSFHRELLPRIEDSFIATGRLRLVSTLFPINEPGLQAATVALSAPAAEFHAVVARLFDQREAWAAAEPSARTALLAAASGREPFAVAAMIEDTPLRRAILERRQWANQALGINVTPSLLYGSRLERGAPDFDGFRRQVEAAERALSRRAA